MMFAQRFIAGFKKTHLSSGRERRSRVSTPIQSGSRVDVVSEQVKEMLQTSGQKLILMVRS